MATLEEPVPVPADAPAPSAPQAAAEPEGEPKRKPRAKAGKLVDGLDLQSPPASLPEKRSRAKVEVYTDTAMAKRDGAQFSVQPGKGTKLVEIPNVAHRLAKVTGSDDLVYNLHQVLYLRVGKDKTRKRDVGQFSGFPEAADAAESEKHANKAMAMTKPQMHSVLDLFNISRGSGDDGKKEKQVERLMEFLQKPEALGTQDLADKAGKKKEASRAKRSKRRSRAKVDDGDEPEDEDDAEDAEEEDEEEAEAAAEAEAEAEAAPAKPAQAAKGKAKAEPKAKAKAKAEPKAKAKAKAEPKAKAAAKGKGKRKADGDTEPAAKPAKRTKGSGKAEDAEAGPSSAAEPVAGASAAVPAEGVPDDGQLAQATKDVLDGLETLGDFNLKQLLEALGKQFPALNWDTMADKRKLVKVTAIEHTAGTQGDADEDMADADDADAMEGGEDAPAGGAKASAAEQAVDAAMEKVESEAKTDKELEDAITAPAPGAAMAAPAADAPAEEAAKASLDGKTAADVKNSELHVNTHV